MLERFFQLSAHGTSVRREVVAGLTTFAAMAYILVVNPELLSATGLDRAGLVTVTGLAAAIGTAMMALLSNYPIALAPGMGLNAFFAFTIVLGLGVPWEAALGLVFWNGVFFLALSLTGLRTRIAEAVPESIKVGTQCGIGLFIAFIGLKNAGLVVDHPATLVTLGDLSAPGPLLAFGGILAALALVRAKVPGGILLTIVGVTAIGLLVPDGAGGTVTARPEALVALPASPAQTFLGLDLLYPFRHPAEAIPIILALLFVDLFDTIGTLLGVSRRAGLVDDEGRLPRMGRALTADAAATVTGALLGTSTTTSYIESAAGVEAGGRTGLTGLVVAACFLAALVFGPLITVVPPAATAPALVLVGILMMQGIRSLDLDNLLELAPAFVTMALMPLTFSISEGIALGFIVHAAVHALAGRAKAVSPLAWVLAAVFAAHYALG